MQDLTLPLFLFETASFASKTTEESLSLSKSPLVTIGYLMQVFISLLIVLCLIYLVAKYLLPRLQIPTKGRIIQLVDRVFLEPQVSAYILRVKNKSWLVVASAKNVELIGEVEVPEERI